MDLSARGARRPRAHLGSAAASLSDHRGDVDRASSTAGRGRRSGPPHREPDWKRRRKDAELALATKVSVASAFTREVARAVRPRRADRGHALRIPGRRLRAAAAAARRAVHRAVGRHPRPAQGDALPARGLEARRDPGRGAASGRAASAGQVVRRRLRGHLPTLAARPQERARRALRGRRSARRFRRSGDGFGLVIQEAMCSGTPVRHHAVRRRPRVHHRRRRRLDGPAARHRRAGRAAARLRRRSRAAFATSAARRGRAPSAGPGATPAERWSPRCGAERRDARPLPQSVLAGGERAGREPADAARRADSPGRRGARRAAGAGTAGRRATRRSALASTSRRWRSCAAISRSRRRSIPPGWRARWPPWSRSPARSAPISSTRTWRCCSKEGSRRALLRIPHVLHYRGNTLDRPKLGLRRARRGLDARRADHVYCISGATAEVFEAPRPRRQGRGALQPDRSSAAFAGASSDRRRFARALGARSGPAARRNGRADPSRARISRPSSARPPIVAAEAPEARFVVVGAAEAPVEDDYQEQLTRLVRRARASSRRLTFAGARRDIPAVMRALDVFVLTSRHEGFGRVVAEAMAAARPVVVTDEGAPARAGRAAGRYGLCAPPGDAAAFAAPDPRACSATAPAPRRSAARAAEAARQFDAATIADRVWTRYQALVRAR